jgi:hypothetical protein
MVGTYREHLIGTGAMGYDLQITRKEDWWDPDGPEISMAEWLALVAADPEMRLDGYAEARLDNGHVFRSEKEGLSVWTGLPIGVARSG